MALENLGFGLALSWIYDAFITREPEPSESSKFLAERREARSRGKSRGAQEIETASREDGHSEGSKLYYPGLVNISGTYCFMNSVLQTCASSNYLINHLENVTNKAEYWDVPTPVTDCLKETLTTLNTPENHRSALRPTRIIDALSAPVPYPSTSSSSSQDSFKSPLFSSREHQDAQELFQLLSSLTKDEAIRVDREPDIRELSMGLGGALLAPFSEEEAQKSLKNVEVSKSVFDGLTANRRSCVVCGYTEAVMHFGFDNLQLSLPFTASVTLEDCLADLTRIEMLNDCICRKCSLIATHRRLQEEVAKLSPSALSSPIHTTISNGHLSIEVEDDQEGSPSSTSLSISKKRRIKEAKKYEQRVASVLSEGRIEDDLGKTLEAKVEKVRSKASTKQVMIARAPPVLVLHLNRSSYFGHGAAKNSCKVSYPELLDMTPWTTSGELSTVPSMPISSPQSSASHSILSALHSHTAPNSNSLLQPSSSPTPPSSKVWYLLTGIVCHFGGHAFGHYISYRRKPRPLQSSSSSSSNSRLPNGSSLPYQRFRPPTFADLSQPLTGKGWLRISDSNVEEVGIESVLSENGSIFLAFYERIVEDADTDAEDYDILERQEIGSSLSSSSNSTASGSTIKASHPNSHSQSHSHSHSHSRSVSDKSHLLPSSGSSHTHVNGNARLPLMRASQSFSSTTSVSASSSRASTPRIIRSVSARIPPRSIASVLGMSSTPAVSKEGSAKFASLRIEPVASDSLHAHARTGADGIEMKNATSKLLESPVELTSPREGGSPVASSSSRSPEHRSGTSRKSKHRKHKK